MNTTTHILLATYQGAEHLPEQLHSIEQQTFCHWHLWARDDGSTDVTRNILQAFAHRHPDRTTLLEGQGGGAARNFWALLQAVQPRTDHDLFAFCDQDDVWLPEKTARLLAAVQALEARTGADTPCLAHSDLTVVGGRLRVISPSFAAFQRIDPADVNARTLLSVNQVTGCAMLINRALLELALPMPAEVVMHDWWLAQLSGSGARQYLPEPLILYRQHGRNQLGARDRGLASRLKRLASDGGGVVRRVRQLGRGTRAQAEALQQRLQQRGLSAGYVAEYLAWRQRSLPQRALTYKTYYVGPALDCLSRLLLWH